MTRLKRSKKVKSRGLSRLCIRRPVFIFGTVKLKEWINERLHTAVVSNSTDNNLFLYVSRSCSVGSKWQLLILVHAYSIFLWGQDMSIAAYLVVFTL